MTSAPIPVFDGHNDTLLRHFLPGGEKEKASFFERAEKGHIDMPRAREGGLAGGFFAIFVPGKKTAGRLKKRSINTSDEPLPPPLKFSRANEVTMAMAAGLYQIERQSKGRFKVVLSAGELEKSIRKGVMAAILHFEGAEAIDADLNALEVYYQAGLRSLGLVWSRPNIFAEGVPFRFPHSPDTGPGLSDAGKALVKACNQLGVMVDLSHLNEKGFWDVAKLSTAPLVATHSNVHALCPSTRNLTDAQLDAIRESDGMVGLNFHVAFLREDGRSEPDTSLDIMVRHIDYLVERLGVERVGFGSDFDGATMPSDLGDAAGLPRLIDALRTSGYDDDMLRKIAHENWMRVLRKTWKPA